VISDSFFSFSFHYSRVTIHCTLSAGKALSNRFARAGKDRSKMDGQQRSDIRPGKRVEIILKKDQRTGKRTVGTVKDILTSSSFHSRGIKVRLVDGQIGRVQEVLSDEQ
jgi:uncharacterized repeat protein (TIGR03833 family)